jgi:hypothetical protein
MSHYKLKTMKTNSIKLLALFFITSLTFTSCSSDDDGDDHDHEEELITTVIYTLTNNADNTDVVTLTFTDLDGEGGNEGVYTPALATLSANTTYSGVIQLLNATENPAEDITEEVENEAEEHEFFYTSSITDVNISKDDTDADGNPLGIETTVVTGMAGTGSLTVILKHEPTKPNDGTSAGAGGSTDAQVSYAIAVQ